MDGQIDMFGNIETSYESEIAAFRAECEKYIQSHGTGFINGKKRILDHYNDGTLTEDVLRVEYGTGGQSARWEASGILFRQTQNHSQKKKESMKSSLDMRTVRNG